MSGGGNESESARDQLRLFGQENPLVPGLSVPGLS
jgi:hypothetical protein